MNKILFCIARKELFRLYDIATIILLTFYINKLSVLDNYNLLHLDFHLIATFVSGIFFIVSFYLFYQKCLELYNEAYSMKNNENPKESYEDSLNTARYYLLRLFFTFQVALLINFLCLIEVI